MCEGVPGARPSLEHVRFRRGLLGRIHTRAHPQRRGVASDRRRCRRALGLLHLSQDQGLPSACCAERFRGDRSQQSRPQADVDAAAALGDLGQQRRLLRAEVQAQIPERRSPLGNREGSC